MSPETNGNDNRSNKSNVIDKETSDAAPSRPPRSHEAATAAVRTRKPRRQRVSNQPASSGQDIPADTSPRASAHEATGVQPSARPPDAAAVDQPVDGLALWESESEGHAPAGLNTVRIDGSESLLIPFTVMMRRVVLHYVGFGAISGYAQCNGPGCLICAIGRQQEIRDVWPVYTVLSKTIEVLPISQNVRPHALRPQISPLLRRLAGGEGPLLISVRKEMSRYTVAALSLPPGADDGAVAIGSFQDRIKAGLIDLASAYQKLTNGEWAAVEEVKTIMTAKGVML